MYPCLIRTIQFYLVLFTFFAVSPNALNAQHEASHKYHLLAGKSFVESKNYYLLTLSKELPEVRNLFVHDTILANIQKNKVTDLNKSLKSCDTSGLCFIEKMQFSDEEIKTIGERLRALYKPGNALDKLVRNHLIPSGTYILFKNLNPQDMLVKAWEQDANGINYAIDVYAAGKKPNYPNIDSISFNVRDPQNHNIYSKNYLALLYDAASVIAAESSVNQLFFYPSLSAALLFIEMNEREQAADFEPMTNGENKERASTE